MSHTGHVKKDCTVNCGAWIIQPRRFWLRQIDRQSKLCSPSRLGSVLINDDAYALTRLRAGLPRFSVCLPTSCRGRPICVPKGGRGCISGASGPSSVATAANGNAFPRNSGAVSPRFAGGDQLGSGRGANTAYSSPKGSSTATGARKLDRRGRLEDPAGGQNVAGICGAASCQRLVDSSDPGDLLDGMSDRISTSCPPYGLRWEVLGVAADEKRAANCLQATPTSLPCRRSHSQRRVTEALLLAPSSDISIRPISADCRSCRGAYRQGDRQSVSSTSPNLPYPLLGGGSGGSRPAGRSCKPGDNQTALRGFAASVDGTAGCGRPTRSTVAV